MLGIEPHLPSARQEAPYLLYCLFGPERNFDVLFFGGGGGGSPGSVQLSSHGC